jgi:tetratricopeptide (TPR) repeat protein
MTKKKMTRKELLKEPDEFITLTGRIISWAKTNKKTLTYGGYSFLAVVLLIIGFGYYQDNRSKVSSELLGDSLIRYQELAAAGDVAQALTAVGPEFDRLVDIFSGQPAGRLGILFYAHYNLAGQVHEKAAGLYRLALKQFKDDSSLTPVILYGLATSLESSGAVGEAIETYEKLAMLETKMYLDSALFNLGRLYASEGQAEKSREMYQRLTTDFPDSNLTRLAREKATG